MRVSAHPEAAPLPSPRPTPQPLPPWCPVCGCRHIQSKHAAFAAEPTARAVLCRTPCVAYQPTYIQSSCACWCCCPLVTACSFSVLASPLPSAWWCRPHKNPQTKPANPKPSDELNPGPASPCALLSPGLSPNAPFSARRRPKKNGHSGTRLSCWFMFMRGP